MAMKLVRRPSSLRPPPVARTPEEVTARTSFFPRYQPGDLVGPARRFKLEAIIGEGGMGVVYRAMDLSLQRQVAIKTVKFGQPEHEERFKTEIRLLALLDEPHITSVYDFFEDKEQFFLVMAFVRGESLRKLLQKQRTLSLVDSFDVAEQLCSALAGAHRTQIVHRDIKPENILISWPHGQLWVDLVDFGLGAAVASPDLLRRNDSRISGTAAYMAPEVKAAGLHSPQSDIFAVGMVIAEMLTGELINTPRLLLSKCESLRLKRPAVARALEALCVIALQHEPDDRFINAKDYLDSIRAMKIKCLQTEAGSVRPAKPAPAPKSRRWGSLLIFWLFGILVGFVVCRLFFP